MQRRHTFLALLATSLLGACAQPVPAEKSKYIGEWEGLAMALLITQDGSIAYKRLKGGVATSISGPLKRFDGDNFVVGFGPVTTTFEVSVPPHQDGTDWKMTVDGVELTRVRRSADADAT